MTAAPPPLAGVFRATDKVGSGSEATAADLLAFAEHTVRAAAGPGTRLAGVTLQLLAPAPAATMTAEAVCLGSHGSPVWRVTIRTNETAVAEVLVTLATASVETAKTVPPAQAGETKPKPQRRPDAESRRARIALAARDVFAAKGYAAATIREVAAAAEMHVPTMYQYVRSKEELLELVYDWTISHAVAGMDAVLTAPGAPEQRIDAIVRRLHDVNRDLRRGTLVMNRETRSLSRDARARILGEYAGMVSKIAEVIEEGQESNAFRRIDPHLASVFIDALADVWVLRPFAVGEMDYDTYTAELSAFVRGALGAVVHVPGEPGPTANPSRQESDP